MSRLPLVVDLDGTLCGNDTLHEIICRAIRRSPWILVRVPGWWWQSRARVKAGLSQYAGCDPARLVYNPLLLAALRQAQNEGQRVVLATGADRRIARAVAAHLGISGPVLASDGHVNRIAAQKRIALLTLFGEKGFIYAGDSAADQQVWPAAAQAWVVGKRQPNISVSARFPAVLDASAWLRLPRWSWLGLLPAAAMPLLLGRGGATNAVTVAVVLGAALLVGAGATLIRDGLMSEVDRQAPATAKRPMARAQVSPLYGALAGVFFLGISWLVVAATCGMISLLTAIALTVVAVWSCLVDRSRFWRRFLAMTSPAFCAAFFAMAVLLSKKIAV